MRKVRANPAVTSLAEFFHRNGCVRKPREDRREVDGRAYRKGYEVRLVANSKEELRIIQRHLKAAAFAAGKPYLRSNQYVQPLYGKDAVTKFLSLVQRPARKGAAPRPREAPTTARRLSAP